MKQLPAGAVEVSREALMGTAHILGQDSAAAQALRDAEIRESAGEVVGFFRLGQTILVGPRPNSVQREKTDD
ncbi:TPA: hypothetical protein VDU83_002535 [Pseudomonas aeruginosa]|nr:hypothetical protein [Pseudomonas aeruginosa]